MGAETFKSLFGIAALVQSFKASEALLAATGRKPNITR